MARRSNTTTRYIEVQGTKELRRELRQLKDKTEKKAFAKELKTEYKRAAETVAWRARDNVPAGGTGELAGSIKARATLRGAAIVAGGPKVPYAGPIEYGWPSRPNKARGWRGGPITARKFMRRAVEDAEPTVLKIMQRGVAVMLRKVEDAAK